VRLLSMLLIEMVFTAAQAAVPDGPLEGFGTGLPLGQAIDDIVPSGLNIVISNSVDPSTLVTWEGGKSWKASLKAALIRVGMIARIGEADVVIELAPPPAQTWEVVEGETVAQTIERWSRQAGYTPVPVFAAQDRWRLFVSQHYEGSFEDALEWLSKGFSRQPNKPVFYLGTNKTIDILSQPTGFTPADNAAGRF
jgi:hypothetical protein